MYVIRVRWLTFVVALGAGCCTVTGCGNRPAPAPVKTANESAMVTVPPNVRSGLRAVGEVLYSFKTELVGLSADYPELTGVKNIRVTDNRFEYKHDCKYWGKRGYEDTGPNAVAIGLRFRSMSWFLENVSKIPMQRPPYKWPSLQMVGWYDFHLGENPSPGLSDKLKEILHRHCEMMNELGRLAQNGEIEFDWEVTTLEGILKVHPKYLYKYYIVTDGGRNIALNETLSRVEYSKLRGIKPGTQIRVRGRPGTFLHEGSTEGNPSPFGRTWVVYMKVKEVERTN